MNPFAEEAGRVNRESRIEPTLLSGLAASEGACAELDTQTPALPSSLIVDEVYCMGSLRLGGLVAPAG